MNSIVFNIKVLCVLSKFVIVIFPLFSSKDVISSSVHVFIKIGSKAMI